MDTQNYLTQFLEALTLKGPLDQIDALANACIETGGCYSAGKQGGEITLHGITGNGLSEEEACRSWILAAQRRAEIMQDLREASAIIRRCNGRSEADLTNACKFTLQHSTNATDRNVAAFLLAQTTQAVAA